MAYVKNVRRDNAQYGIKAVALDEALDATILKKSNLVNGFTQTTPGVNALDAAAGKSLNDSLANTDASIANLKNGTDNFTEIAITPGNHTISDDASKSVMSTGQGGNVTALSAAVGPNALMQSQVYLTDKYGALSSRYRTRTSESSAWGSWSSYGYFYPMRHKDISGTTDANGYISIDLDPDITLPVLGSTRKGGGSLSDRYIEFTPGVSSWYGRVTYRGSAVASTAIKFRVWYFDAEQNLV